MVKLIICVVWVLSSCLGSIRCRWARGTEWSEGADGTQHLCSLPSCLPLGPTADSAEEREGWETLLLAESAKLLSSEFFKRKIFPFRRWMAYTHNRERQLGPHIIDSPSDNREVTTVHLADDKSKPKGPAWAQVHSHTAGKWWSQSCLDPRLCKHTLARPGGLREVRKGASWQTGSVQQPH